MSHAIDPVIIGKIGLVILPVGVENIIDFVIDWASRPKEKDLAVTPTLPTPNGEVKIVYDARNMIADQLHEQIVLAMGGAE